MNYDNLVKLGKQRDKINKHLEGIDTFDDFQADVVSIFIDELMQSLEEVMEERDNAINIQDDLREEIYNLEGELEDKDMTIDDLENEIFILQEELTNTQEAYS